MRTLSPGLAAHLAAGVTTLCRCWQVTRSDGSVLGFTDHDRALSFDGTTFEPESGLDASEDKSETGFAIGGLEAIGRALVGAADGSRPRRRPLRPRRGVGVAGQLDDARRTPSAARRPSRRGDARGRHFSRRGARACRRTRPAQRARLPPWLRCRSRRQALRHRPRRRGVSRHRHRDRGERQAALHRERARCDSLPDGSRADGLPGPAAPITAAPSRCARIGSPTASQASSCGRRWRGDIAAGDTFTVTAGCDKLFSTCQAKFANAVNFRGFPHMPGNDFVLSYARAGDGNDGSAIVE